MLQQQSTATDQATIALDRISDNTLMKLSSRWPATAISRYERLTKAPRLRAIMRMVPGTKSGDDVLLPQRAKREGAARCGDAGEGQAAVLK
jgi:hypothetical protein